MANAPVTGTRCRSVFGGANRCRWPDRKSDPPPKI